MALRGWKKRWLVRGGYAAFAMFCFVIFAYLTFPYERLKGFVIKQVAKPAEAGGVSNRSLSIGELEPHLLTGVSATDVEFVIKADAPDAPSTVITLDSLTARHGIFPAIIGNTGVTFQANVGTGEASGDFSDDGSTRHIEAELDAVSVNQLGLAGALGVPVTGTLSGTIDLTVSEDPTLTEGFVDLKFDKLAIGDGKAKVLIPGMRGGLTLERVNVGNLEVRAEVTAGVAKIKKLEADGKDLKLTGKGTVRIGKTSTSSRVDVTLEFKIADAYKNRSDRTKAIFQLIGANPQMKRATTPKGALRYEITGTLSKPRAMPAGQARTRRTPAKTPRRAGRKPK